ncbi:hypothetical protein RDI58_006744 [Solanum bulbocastanum]|uniref:Uncharacterized protein n=1 Tax=Solanum bulbocastanum TaxID=147425 RepID=A0AAN8TXE3_SOLBU
MTTSSTVGGQSGEPKEAPRFVTFWFSSLISGYVSLLLCFPTVLSLLLLCFFFFLFFSYSFFAVFMLLLQLLIFICAL